MAGNNAPNAVNQPSPYPNVVVPFNKRIVCNVVDYNVTGTTLTINNGNSTGGVTGTRNGVGDYTFTVPAPGTGGIGWATVCPARLATPGTANAQTATINATTTNFATGTVRIALFDSGTPAAIELAGNQTVLVYTVAP